jgi:WD40 repeat protein
VPSLTIHPTNGFFVGQSLDNTIVTYQCGEKLRQMKKKTFRGHNNSGYACQIGFSPNGKFLVSGDGFGKLHFWDFKTTRVIIICSFSFSLIMKPLFNCFSSPELVREYLSFSLFFFKIFMIVIELKCFSLAL